MKNKLVLLLSLVLIVSWQGYAYAQADFFTSLHYTSRGMGYWYDAEQGGLETVSGIPYDSLSCKHCHATGCSDCHEGEEGMTGEIAGQMETCLKCHSREKNIMAVDEAAGNLDVHIAAGMVCVDCHSSREIHGDGVEWKSMKEPGAMDTQCENCHETVTESRSHTVHGDKLDCKACHERHVLSCTNCHFDTFLETGSKVAMPKSGWMFLMNYKGKVCSANMQNYVVNGNSTLQMFAPAHTHSVQREGRDCDECHGNASVMSVQNDGEVNLTWVESGEVKKVSGVVPVKAGVKYNFVYHSYDDGTWTPIESVEEPVIHFAGFGDPLTDAQMAMLATPMGSSGPSCDLNDDGSLDIEDVIALVMLQRNSPNDSDADFNGDGMLNIADPVALIKAIRNGDCAEGAGLAGQGNPNDNVSKIEGLSTEDIEYLESIMKDLNLTPDEEAAYRAALYGVQGSASLPRAYALAQNSPNPFNPSTTIEYSVPDNTSSSVTIKVYSLRGALIRTLVDGNQAPGVHTVYWDGSDYSGRKVSSGVYLYRMEAGQFSRTRKMVMLK